MRCGKRRRRLAEVQAKLAKGVREGKPENVIWILKWVGESPPTYVLPARIVEWRYADGKTPQGELVDLNLTEHFGHLREDAGRIPALAVVEFTDEDLDRLDAAADSPEYPSVLSEIVTRIQKGRQHE
jgi:hypothetical protein